MDLDNPVVVAVLSIAFVIFATIVLVAQIIAYAWSRRIEHELLGQEGHALALLISRLVGAVLGVQVTLFIVILLYVFTKDSSSLLRAVLIVSQQGVLAYASVAALLRARRLQRPVDPSGEAVVEEVAQPVAEVPQPTSDVGAAVDHGSNVDLVIPAELHLRPARKRPTRNADKARR